MSLETVRSQFEGLGIADRIQIFGHSSATVDLAAQTIGCAPDEIAKTLAFDVKGTPVLVVTAGLARIDNHKFKQTFHAKSKMMSPQQTLEITGHPVGGVCPFGIPEGIEVYLDTSLKAYKTVYPACGSTNSGIAMSIGELETVSQAKNWVDVCKKPDALQ